MRNRLAFFPMAVAGLFPLETLSGDTRASQNAFGGRAVYFWIYRGGSITSASEHLIVKSSATFPTDPEIGAPLQSSAALRPGDVAAVVVGNFAAFAYDYEAGSGPLPGYSTTAPTPEPASTTLLALGLSLMLGRRMRRKFRS